METAVLPTTGSHDPADGTRSEAEAPAPPRRRATAMVGPVILFLLAILLCVTRLGNAPEFDELYHVLAARGWLQTGHFTIAEGEYVRTGLFTLLIGVLFRLLGESIAVARLPSVAAYALLIVFFFMWMRARTGSAAAWISSLLLLLSPFMLEIGTFARFYAIQVLAFFGAVVLIDGALRLQVGAARRVGFAAAASLLLILAVYLQIVTLIGILGIGVWAAIEFFVPWYLHKPRSMRFLFFGLALAASAALLVYMIEMNILQRVFIHFRSTPDFQSERVNQFWFYHFWFVLYYPILWTTFPMLLLFSLAAYPRMARLCGSIFITAFVLHSLAGPKDTRYIAYALPFLFAIFGMGMAAVWPKLRRLVVGALWQAVDPPSSSVVRSRLETAAIGIMLALVILANGAAPRLITMLVGIRIPPQPPLASWRAAANELAPWLHKAQVVVTTDELYALYYLGRYDVLISPSRLSELPTGQDFARDDRTGRPVIASPEAMQSILDCFADGLVVSDRTRMEGSSTRDIARFLARETQPLSLPRAWSIDAYVWENRPSTREPSFCQGIVRRLDRKD